MLVQTVVLHAIGEDNEGNVALVARTTEALRAKVLAWHNDCFDGEPDQQFATYEDLVASETYAMAFGEDLLDD